MRKNSIIKGIFFIYAGVLIAGMALGWISISLLADGWWAVFFIIPAALKILFDGLGSGRLFIMSLGIMLFLAGRGRLGYISIINMAVPLLLVSWGIDLVFKSFFPYNHEASSKIKVIRHITGTVLSILFLMAFAVVLNKALILTDGDMEADKSSYSSYFNEFQDINELVINTGNTAFTIIQGDSLTVYSDNLHSSYSIYSEEGTLYIEKDSIFNLAEFILDGWEMFPENTEITVTIPSGLMLDVFEIDCGSGAVYIEGIKAEDFKADFGSGAVSVIGCTAYEADISSRSGACYFRDFKTDKMVFNSSSGTVTFESSAINGLELDSGSGMFYFSGMVAGKNKIKSGSGSVTLVIDGDIEDYYIKGDAGSGGIWINGNRRDEISLGDDGAAGSSFKIEGGSGRVSVEISREDGY